MIDMKPLKLYDPVAPHLYLGILMVSLERYAEIRKRGHAEFIRLTDMPPVRAYDGNSPSLVGGLVHRYVIYQFSPSPDYRSVTYAGITIEQLEETLEVIFIPGTRYIKSLMTEREKASPD